MADEKALASSQQKSRHFNLQPDGEGGFVGEVHDLQVSSPIPPANELKKLGEVIPNGPERVLVMAEKALAHRMALEKKAEETEAYLSKRCIWLAFIIACLGIVCSTILILRGHTIVGTILSAGTLATIIASFMSVVWGKDSGNFSQEEKPASKQKTPAPETSTDSEA